MVANTFAPVSTDKQSDLIHNASIYIIYFKLIRSPNQDRKAADASYLEGVSVLLLAGQNLTGANHAAHGGSSYMIVALAVLVFVVNDDALRREIAAYPDVAFTDG